MSTMDWGRLKRRFKAEVDVDNDGDLSEESGVSMWNIRRIFTGQAATPVVMELANHYKMKLSKFFSLGESEDS